MQVLSDLGKAMTPQDTVDKLDSYIVGQADAKKAVAISMRNRWRRFQLPEDLKNEVTNIALCWLYPVANAARLTTCCNGSSCQRR